VAPLLEIKKASKRFGGLPALNDVSLTIEEGEFRGIIGPNGSGKSTLFNLIVGRYRPTSGEIFFKGRNIVGMRPDQRARLGITIKFQITNVFDGLRVVDNVLLGLLSSGRWSEEGLKEGSETQAMSILERIGLAEKAKEKAGTLSHGQKQWLEIGMALSTRPSLLLLDEPTSGMGVEETRQTAEIISQLKGDLTILIIEHDMDFVRTVTERITVLNRGQFLTEGIYDEVKADKRVIEAYLGKGRQ
jgi:branched-chain amino acid transport system ATP-binding protein